MRSRHVLLPAATAANECEYPPRESVTASRSKALPDDWKERTNHTKHHSERKRR